MEVQDMLPLHGISVVEIAQNLAGPIAAEILGHMGADANKRSVTLNLKQAADVEWLLELIGRADVLVQNLRPGSLEEMGLGAKALTERFPRLVYCSVWAFGSTGPLK